MFKVIREEPPRTKTSFSGIKKERITVMKKVKKIFNRIANADPMIWGYVMLNDNLGKKKRSELSLLQ